MRTASRELPEELFQSYEAPAQVKASRSGPADTAAALKQLYRLRKNSSSDIDAAMALFRIAIVMVSVGTLGIIIGTGLNISLLLWTSSATAFASIFVGSFCDHPKVIAAVHRLKRSSGSKEAQTAIVAEVAERLTQSIGVEVKEKDVISLVAGRSMVRGSRSFRIEGLKSKVPRLIETSEREVSYE